jgi:uncharacterized protein
MPDRPDLPVARRLDPIPPPAPPPAPPPVARPAEDREPPRRRRTERDDEEDEKPAKPKPVSPMPMLVCVGTHGVIVWTLLFGIFGLAIYVGLFSDIPRGGDESDIPPEKLRRYVMTFQTLIGGLHMAIILGAIVIAGRPKPRPAIVPPAVGWAGGFPVLALVLIMNVGLGVVIRYVFKVKPEDDPTELSLATDGLLAVLLICVEPAIIEELFYRYLLLGHLRDHVNVHVAVILSSMFFAAAHIGQLPGMPILFVVGAALGYARVCSGSLLLPIIMHFLHNLAVISVPLWIDK